MARTPRDCQENVTFNQTNETWDETVEFFDTDLSYHVLVWILLLIPNLFGASFNLRAGFGFFVLNFFVRNGILLGIIYLNFWVLIPRFFRQRKRVVYFLLCFLLVAIGVASNIVMGNVMGARMGFPEQDMNTQFVEAAFYFFNISSYVLTAFLLYSLREKQLQKKRLEELQHEKLTSEIKYLRAQINPHFLFNTLNNLYGLSLQGSAQTGEVIIKLSRMMDFMLHDSTDAKVYLKDDVENIQNYVDIERIRQGNNADILFELTGSIREQKIAPLLILPLIENAFKHGVNTIIEGAFMHAQIHVGEQRVEVRVRNNFRALESTPERVGIGWKNLKRRLELFYPGKHSIEVHSDDGVYDVQLSIDLS